MIRTVFSTMFFLTWGAVSIIEAQTSGNPGLAVTGFTNKVDHKEWQDARVGMGVRAMLSQALAETGLFTLLEEKPEIKAQLEEIARNAWSGKQGEDALGKAMDQMKVAGARFIASGKVFYFGKPRTRASVGPAHFASDEVVIKIEVTLAAVSTGKKITAIGSGKAKTTAAAGLFTYHGENLDADASMAGTATKKAIDDAVGEIVKKYKKAYKVK
jgi:curli biogenesis system outer membrane secretion channel CsgG